MSRNRLTKPSNSMEHTMNAEARSDPTAARPKMAHGSAAWERWQRPSRSCATRWRSCGRRARSRRRSPKAEVGKAMPLSPLTRKRSRRRQPDRGSAICSRARPLASMSAKRARRDARSPLPCGRRAGGPCAASTDAAASATRSWLVGNSADTDFQRAHLSSARLQGASLRGADLTGKLRRQTERCHPARRRPVQRPEPRPEVPVRSR
jgi:hypothetical protein